MAYFIAENLHQEFENININVSFECEKSTLTCIVGPSGSGKSTVLRLISGLNKPFTSKKENSTMPKQKIILDDCDISDLPPAKRDIGMVFQSHSLFDHLTVVQNVAYGLISKGMKKKEAIIMASDFLKHFELNGFENRFPETLSGGEAQRVCLARTLIMKPKLVLFDEPLSALDAPLRKKLAKLIKTSQEKIGFTGIMVTHDLDEAKAVANKIILMKKGEIVWSGNSSEFDENFLTDLN